MFLRLAANNRLPTSDALRRASQSPAMAEQEAQRGEFQRAPGR